MIDGSSQWRGVQLVQGGLFLTPHKSIQGSRKTQVALATRLLHRAHGRGDCCIHREQLYYLSTQGHGVLQGTLYFVRLQQKKEKTANTPNETFETRTFM